ncbi:MAG: hypothetical protein QM680_08385 [Luteolibacter sp.]
MKLITYLISGFLILIGLGALAMPVAAFSSPEKTLYQILMACGLLAFSFCCIAAGIQHFIKKDQKTALQVVGIIGFVGWLILSNWAISRILDKNDLFLRVVALLLPLVACFLATRFFQRIINNVYAKASNKKSNSLP